MQNWPSTVGLAIMAAYWLLVLVFIVVSLILSFLLVGRARVAKSGAPMAGAILGGVVPSVLGVGAGAERHPGWALFFTFVAVAFSLWWMQNMAKREP